METSAKTDPTPLAMVTVLVVLKDMVTVLVVLSDTVADLLAIAQEALTDMAREWAGHQVTIAMVLEDQYLPAMEAEYPQAMESLPLQVMGARSIPAVLEAIRS